MARVQFLALSVVLFLFSRAFTFLPFPCADAEIVNQTIDDSFGDLVTGAKVLYFPSTQQGNNLNVFWSNEDQCAGCAIVPDKTQAFNNTWTSATYVASIGQMSATMSFDGTAIYVYLIVSNAGLATGLVSTVICDFLLDGSIVGSFLHNTDETNIFYYNVMAFSRDGLPSGSHTLSIQTTGNESSYVIFDRAVYTTEVDDATSAPSISASSLLSSFSSDPSSSITIPPPSVYPAAPTSKHRISAGPIVGGVVGVVAALLLTISLLWFRRWRAKGHHMVRPARIRRGSSLNLMSGTSVSSFIQSPPPPPGSQHDLERQLAERDQHIEDLRLLVQQLRSQPALSESPSSAAATRGTSSKTGRPGRIKRSQRVEAGRNLPPPIEQNTTAVIHSDSRLRMGRSIAVNQHGDEQAPIEMREFPPTYAHD